MVRKSRYDNHKTVVPILSAVVLGLFMLAAAIIQTASDSHTTFRESDNIEFTELRSILCERTMAFEYARSLSDDPLCPLTFDEFFTFLGDPSVTELQRNDRLTNITGNRFVFEGKLENIHRISGNRISVCIQSPYYRQRIAYFLFTHEHSDILILLSRNQRVMITGVLHEFSDYPVFVDAKLLCFDD